MAANSGTVMTTSSHKTDWTDEETSTLVRMWPKAMPTQIANSLHRSHMSIVNKATWLRRKGLLEMKRVQPSTVKKWRSKTPLKPDNQDFDAVKMDYCRQHQITVAELSARFEQNDQLVAEFYRLAQTAKCRRVNAETPAEQTLHMGGPALSAGPDQS
jgi:hypothetical protein